MQRAVERDEQNRLNDAMCAVNPSCVGNTFDVAALHEIADTLKCERLSLGDRKLQRRGAALISRVSIQSLMYSSGSTICLRGRGCCITSSYECPQLSQDARG
jgi:hypothetical protein